MREMLEVRGYSPNTIEIYVNHLINLAAYFNKPPNTLTKEEIHQYQVFIVHEKQVSWSWFNQSVCAMRFFLTMLSAMTGRSNTFPIRKSRKPSPSF